MNSRHDKTETKTRDKQKQRRLHALVKAKFCPNFHSLMPNKKTIKHDNSLKNKKLGDVFLTWSKQTKYHKFEQTIWTNWQSLDMTTETLNVISFLCKKYTKVECTFTLDSVKVCVLFYVPVLSLFACLLACLSHQTERFPLPFREIFSFCRF
jgi:hypothetical protein